MDSSNWTRGEYSEFTINAVNHLTISASDLPDWMEFNQSTGILSGTPNNANTTTITITASNPAHNRSQSHLLNVFDPSVFTTRMKLNPMVILTSQTPHDLPGLVLKLDATSFEEANGSIVRYWNDTSGNGRNLDQFRGSPKVISNEQLNKRNVVSFDGYSQLYSTTNFGALFDDYTITGLIRYSGEIKEGVVCSVGTDWIFGLGDGKSAYWKINDSLAMNTPTADENWHILTGTAQRNGNIKLWLDGYLVLSEFNPSEIDYKPGAIALGGAQANTSFSTSEVAEILLYNRNLNDPERMAVEDYLRIKWMSGKLEEFPLLVRLSDGQHPDFALSTFADPENGGDLRFRNLEGKTLKYEVDEWNGSNGESTIWVKAENLQLDHQIFAYWGNEDNTTLPSYRTDGSVWSGYEGVWHFSGFTDSSSRDRATTASGSPQIELNGISGSSIRLDGIDDTISISGYKGIGSDNERSIETWVQSEQSSSGVLGWGGSGNRWNFGWTQQGPKIHTDNNNGERQGSGPIGGQGWVHLLASYPGNGADLNATRLFLNGQLVDALSFSSDGTVNTDIVSGSDLIIGAFADSSSRLNGWLDETRVSSVVRSHAWARLSYENQRKDQNFFEQTIDHLKVPEFPDDLNLTVIKDESVSFIISSTPPAAFYQLDGTLPDGLTFNLATGELSGTSTVTGNFEPNVTATNGKGSSTATFMIDAVEEVENPVIRPGQATFDFGPRG